MTVDLEQALLVWDVDGTLLDAGGAGHRALAQAILAVTGRPVSLTTLDVAGQTDRLLIEQALRLAGASARHWDAVRRVYPDVLQAELHKSPVAALPGIPLVLDALAAHGVAGVLGTGNLEVGAYRKLACAHLAGRFAAGGFGDRHRTRVPVIQDAIRAGRARWGRRLRPVIVGDTPRDARAAHALGVPVVLVATGRFAAAELAPLSPWLLEDFRDVERGLRVLGDAVAASRRPPAPGQ